MLNAASKSVKKQQGISKTPKDGADSTSSSAEQQQGSQGQITDAIEYSPTPEITRGGRVKQLSAVPTQQQKAALDTWSHAQRVSQGLSSPLMPTSAHQSAHGHITQMVTGKTQTTPSLTSQVEKLRSIITAAVAQTATPIGSMDRPTEIDLTPAEIFQVQRDLAFAKTEGPISADAILNIRLLGEIKAMKEQFAHQQAELVEQRARSQALTHLVQSLGSRSEPVLVSSQSPAQGSTPFTQWLENNIAPAGIHTQLSQEPRAARSPSSMAQHQTDMVHSPGSHARQHALHEPMITTVTADSLHKQQSSPEPLSQHADTLPSRVTIHTKRSAVPSQKRSLPGDVSRNAEQRAYKASQQTFAANAQDERIIRQAQERMARRQSQAQSQGMTRPPKLDTSKPSRTSEMRIAALINDEELLRHGSDKVRREAQSDDDPEEALLELDPAIASANILNPHQKRPTRTKHGYVKSTFVASSDDDVDPTSEGEVDDDEHDTPTEDSNDPDWSPSSTPTPSPSRKAISKSEYRDFLEFRRAKQAGNTHKPHDALSQRITVSVAEPPKHGTWNDVHYLVGVFRDEHTTYKHRCGTGTSLTVWECYTQTAKDSIVTFLKSTPKGKLLNRTATYLAKLSDDDLYSLLQNELGLTHSTEVERALYAITFPDSVLEAANWVTFHTAWLQVLHRVSSEVEILPRRMSEIFRESIPDTYISKWLAARKHPTWEQAYTAVIDALSDPKWLVSYIKETTRPPATPSHAAKSHPQPQSKATPVANHQQVTATKPKDTPKQSDKQTRDPLSYKNRYGAINVNPNLNLALDDNPDKIPCTRCIDYTHRWTSDLCTVPQRKDGTKIEPPLTATEFAQRLKARWDKGFFFKEDFSKSTQQHKSPSAKESNNTSAVSASRITASTVKSGAT